MIEMLDQLEPTTVIDWLHSERRVLSSQEQLRPSKGPRTVIPTAVFTIEAYEWTEVEW